MVLFPTAVALAVSALRLSIGIAAGVVLVVAAHRARSVAEARRLEGVDTAMTTDGGRP